MLRDVRGAGGPPHESCTSRHQLYELPVGQLQQLAGQLAGELDRQVAALQPQMAALAAQWSQVPPPPLRRSKKN